MVRVGPLMGLAALVSDLGSDPDPVFRQAGFHVTQFDDPDRTIPFIRGSELLARCAGETGCGHLGLLLGERADPSSLGLAGFLLRTAPDVGSALRELARNLDLHDQGGNVFVETSGKITRFGYRIHVPGARATEQIYDLSLTIACKIMHSLCGDGWNAGEILLSRPKPENTAPYTRFFQAPLRFGSIQNAVAFSTAWLRHRIPSGDPLLHRHLQQEANELHSKRTTPIVSEVRRLLRQHLGKKHCGISAIAGQLGLHERTLNRRLKGEGTTFRQELEAIRYDIARELLQSRKLALSTIAASLGYSDATAFIRAFKQWSGTPPAEWRRTRLDH